MIGRHQELASAPVGPRFQLGVAHQVLMLADQHVLSGGMWPPQLQQGSLIESSHVIDGLGVGYQLQHAAGLCLGELGCRSDGQRLGHTSTLAACRGAARAMFDCSLRSRGSRSEAAAFLSHADEERVCSFVRPGQRRAILGAVRFWTSPRSYAASMSHDEDPTRQVPAYGDTAQPAIAARMAPHLRLTQIGALCGLVSVIAATAAVVIFPSFDGGTGLAWAVGALVSAVL